MKDLEKFFSSGEPVLVKTIKNLLIPQMFINPEFHGESSAITPRLIPLFESCLVPLEDIYFNPKDFIRTEHERIGHLGITLGLMETIYSQSLRERYIYQRHARALAEDLLGKPRPAYEERWEELEDWKKEAILNKLPPEPKIDFTWQVLRSIKNAAMSDAVGVRYRTPGASSSSLTLYEIQFCQKTGNPKVDIYVKDETDKIEI